MYIGRSKELGPVIYGTFAFTSTLGIFKLLKIVCKGFTLWLQYVFVFKSLQLCPILCDPMDCIVRQAPQSMGISRQEYWSGLLFHPLEDLPNPGFEHRSLISIAFAGEFFTTRAILEGSVCIYQIINENGHIFISSLAFYMSPLCEVIGQAFCSSF